jgi:hypothetical protein
MNAPRFTPAGVLAMAALLGALAACQRDQPAAVAAAPAGTAPTEGVAV